MRHDTTLVRPPSWRQWSALAAAVALWSGCGGADTRGGDAATQAPDAAVDAALVEDGGARDASVSHDDGGARDASVSHDDGGAPSEYAHVVWLNFAGRATTSLTGEPWEVPAYSVLFRGGLARSFAFAPGWQDGRDATIADVAARVRALFAPFDVEVTLRRPALDGYIEVVFGGSDLDRAGGTDCASRVGFTPILCGSVDHAQRREVHVFSDCVDGPAAFAGVVAHEVGHSVGLEHVDERTSLMYPSWMGQTTWGSGNVIPFGTSCGASTQDCAALLTRQLGAARARLPAPMPDDLDPPLLEVLAPTEGQHVHPDTVPCVRVSDASALSGHVHLEAFVSEPDPAYLSRTGHVHAAGPSPDFGPLSGITRGTLGAMFLRVSVGDEHGNLAEQRIAVVLDAGAPVLTCP